MSRTQPCPLASASHKYSPYPDRVGAPIYTLEHHIHTPVRDPLLRRASRDALALPSPQLLPQPSPLVGTTLPARAELPWLRPTRQNTIPTLPEAHAWVPRATHRLASFGTCFSEERQGRRTSTRASISCIHDGVRTGSQTTGPSSRPGSVAHPHTGTGLNFPEKEGRAQPPASAGVPTADAEQEASRSVWTAGSGGQARLCTTQPWQSPAPIADSRQAAPGRWPTLTWRLQPQPSG